jgi:hypothetical protein
VPNNAETGYSIDRRADGLYLDDRKIEEGAPVEVRRNGQWSRENFLIVSEDSDGTWLCQVGKAWVLAELEKRGEELPAHLNAFDCELRWPAPPKPRPL